ncbi:MAG: DUF433 domain-containing protein [Pseudonocardiales bacterium]
MTTHQQVDRNGEIMFDRVTVEPGKMNGQPCIRGLRFTVAHLVRLIAAGWTLEQVQEDFPFIEPEDVHQALLYAAEAAEVITLPLRESA